MRQIYIKNLKNVNFKKLLILAKQFSGITVMTPIGAFCLTTSGYMLRLEDNKQMWQNKARRNRFMPPTM